MIYLFIFLFTISPLLLPQPTDSDSKAIENTIIQLFDAMRESNMQKAADMFHEQLQLKTVVNRGAGAELINSSGAEFLEAIGLPKEEPWDEHYSNLEIRIDGDLATAWMDYRFYRGEKFSHCGVNAIKFIRAETGWKMFSITDTRRSENC